jgi:prephenate dehydrogenase
MIDDQPGELARLLTEIGEIGINVEDLKLEHSPGAPIGLVELQVLPNVADKLTKDLTERGWRFA